MHLVSTTVDFILTPNKGQFFVTGTLNADFFGMSQEGDWTHAIAVDTDKDFIWCSNNCKKGQHLPIKNGRSWLSPPYSYLLAIHGIYQVQWPERRVLPSCEWFQQLTAYKTYVQSHYRLPVASPIGKHALLAYADSHSPPERAAALLPLATFASDARAAYADGSLSLDRTQALNTLEHWYWPIDEYHDNLAQFVLSRNFLLQQDPMHFTADKHCYDWHETFYVKFLSKINKMYEQQTLPLDFVQSLKKVQSIACLFPAIDRASLVYVTIGAGIMVCREGSWKRAIVRKVTEASISVHWLLRDYWRSPAGKRPTVAMRPDSLLVDRHQRLAPFYYGQKKITFLAFPPAIGERRSNRLNKRKADSPETSQLQEPSQSQEPIQSQEQAEPVTLAQESRIAYEISKLAWQTVLQKGEHAARTNEETMAAFAARDFERAARLATASATAARELAEASQLAIDQEAAWLAVRKTAEEARWQELVAKDWCSFCGAADCDPILSKMFEIYCGSKDDLFS